ncbi:hypothetical protein AN0527.2 [Aspergillus nidulans FGSC A4]|uniref:YCII-related domain-containing protein n=1 Tax=Emericella nidulans (strain FGSC A4 / ATCC 38163 / CBS 112.46 / NRRL 194 / M139) TaxID=227321 RepID=Q5BG03_EMENI|nr:hypothetical protein [Aspergillus nidulans FGSC A4]EAA66626.1 hypothetical protein AN0527.2 [Aspergillus nidulans FGSC A4]CBF89305.1 TPA: conserved hypothetical protein [Aspergillus nidulans FGSC A4]|eukprot:XP_658131.1 hypothetical protein AN0527.2 [Aspergillus nidulans FGSC A4]
MSQIYDWLVQIPINADDMEAWAETREAHLSHLKPYVLDRTVVFAGPTLSRHPKNPDDPLEITGSVLMLRAGTELEVRDIIAKNPFVEAGVWDMERALVQPFKCGVRTA